MGNKTSRLSGHYASLTSAVLKKVIIYYVVKKKDLLDLE